MTDAGYWIGGFGLGEGIEERGALLSAVTVSPTIVMGCTFPFHSYYTLLDVSIVNMIIDEEIRK